MAADRGDQDDSGARPSSGGTVGGGSGIADTIFVQLLHFKLHDFTVCVSFFFLHLLLSFYIMYI